LKNSKKLVKKTTGIIRNINQKFDLNDRSLLLLLLGQKKDDSYIKELKQNIPQDLVKFRYLMHPTRLMIVKLLSSEYSLSSVEIKRVLDIPWGDYTSHTKSLEKNGYIEIKEQFSEEASVQQMLYLTEKGQQEYEVLFDLLQEFIEKKTPLEYILKADPETYMQDELYPD
jgi:DNA-binding MarR family transcriptional regulator